MPAGSGKYIERPEEDESTVGREEQGIYRGGVFLLMSQDKFPGYTYQIQ